MSNPSDWGDLRRDILGLGETSLRKSHYASLRQRVKELERFRTAIDLSSDLLFILTVPDGDISDANQAACRELGMAGSDLLGRRFSTLLAQEEQAEQAEFSSLTSDLLSGKREQGLLTAELVGPGGVPIPVEIAARLVPGRDSSIVLSVRNITERIRTEQERQRLEVQLQQSQKLEAIGLLAGGVAHDFNNLLTVILGYIGVLRSQLTGGEPESEILDEIQAAGERAAALTRQLLAFGRKQLLQPAVLDLNVLLAEITAMLRRLIPENIELCTEPGEGLGRILADRTQIEQVILNLAVNARDAMPAGGTLTIRTAQLVIDVEPSGGATEIPPGEYVTLSVRDTGVGMEEGTKARIFEPFFTTKEYGRGTGLGLSTVYGIVRQSEGYITVESRVGEGTAFTIFFPATATAPERSDVRTGRSAGNGSETVLLVEDEESVLKLARTVLRQHGYQVLGASDGGEALRISSAHSGPIDVMITDLMMPGISGPELADRLRGLRPEMKILYISGYAAGAIAPESRQGGVPFLQKPFTPAGLLGKLREVLDEAHGGDAAKA